MDRRDAAEVIYNLGADEVEIAAGPFVIYQGSHGDRGAHRADIILPGAAYTEEPGLFVNTEGRPQLAQRAGFAPGQAKENWAILRALSAEMGAHCPMIRSRSCARRWSRACRIWRRSTRWRKTNGSRCPGKLGKAAFRLRCAISICPTRSPGPAS